MNKTPKIFWKITKNINKKFCNNKLKVKEIFLFNKRSDYKCLEFPCPKGIYLVHAKKIGVKKNIPLLFQICLFCHELVHAYQLQILKNKGRHDQEFHRIYFKFVNETDKTLNICLKGKEK